MLFFIPEYNIPMTRHSGCVCVYAVDDRENNNKKQRLEVGLGAAFNLNLNMHL